MSEEEDRLDAMESAIEDPDREIGLEELADILETTIKFDMGNKVITFLVMLGTYTEEEQTNIIFRAESSTGKSYIPLEVILYFPEIDVKKVSFASPTSFFHKYGERRVENTLDEQGRKHQHTYYFIDMSKRLYIFKDMPSVKLLERLRSLLSHDEKEMQIQFTNKTAKSGFRTQHIIIKGYPTVIFCTATAKVFDMQESTRFYVLSPDIENKKIEEAIRLLAQRKGNRKLFTRNLQNNAKRLFLKNRVVNVKSFGIYDVVIPDQEKIAEDFIKSKKHLHPRHMRDFGRLLNLIKYWAILNCEKRELIETVEIREKDKDNNDLPLRYGKIIKSNDTDREVGFILYQSICASNELGVSPEVYRIYQKVFEPNDNGTGLTKEQISAGFLKVFHRPLGARRLNKEILPNLLASGLIYDDETTGKGGKAKVYRLSKHMEEKINGEEINMNGQASLSLPKSLQEKLNFMLTLFLPRLHLDITSIENQTNGNILKEEIPKLLMILVNDNKIYQPSQDTYCRTI